LGRIWYRLDTRHRQVALDNLARAFDGEKSQAEIESLAKKTFEQLGVTAVEVCQLANMEREQLVDWVTLEGEQNFWDAYDHGKGVLMLTGHFGNWELMGILPSALQVPISVVARLTDNPAVEQELTRLRSRFGNRIIHKKAALRETMRVLREGGVVAILIDQNVADREGVFVEYFGRPACTTPTMALLALKSDARVVPNFCVRREDGSHRVFVGPAVDLVRTGDLERDVVVNTQRFTSIIEGYVRRHPDHWLWMHRRWKTQPEPSWAPLEVGS
jgi:KDO2-lipid IV(A) lauroyltransferase